MLSNAGMGIPFWDEATSTTCYLINMSLSIPLDKKLPLRYGLVHQLIIYSSEFSVALPMHMLIMKS
jgi:hypothetical protein